MSVIQRCEYISYKNKECEDEDLYLRKDDIPILILKKVYNVEELESETEYNKCNFFINGYIINKDGIFTTIYICTDFELSLSYIVIPELENNKLIGISAYKINLDILKIKVNTGKYYIYIYI